MILRNCQSEDGTWGCGYVFVHLLCNSLWSSGNHQVWTRPGTTHGDRQYRSHHGRNSRDVGQIEMREFGTEMLHCQVLFRHSDMSQLRPRDAPNFVFIEDPLSSRSIRTKGIPQPQWIRLGPRICDAIVYPIRFRHRALLPNQCPVNVASS